MAKYSNTIEYKLRTDVDLSGLNKLQTALSKTQASLSKMSFNSGGMYNSLFGLNEASTTVTKLQKALSKSFNVKVGMTDISKLTKELQTANVDLTRLYTNLSTGGVAGVQSFNNLLGTIGKINIAMKTTSSLTDKVFNTIGNTVRWGIISGVFESMRNSLGRAIAYVEDLDRSLNDIRIVSGQSAEQMRLFAEQANRAAKNLGATTTEFTKASLIFVQQGYDTNKASQLADLTLKTANVTGQDTATVSEQLTAIVNGYQMQGESIEYVERQIDKLAKVAAVGAADLEELATGFSKVAAVANTLGVSTDQLTAQLSTIISVTREAPEAVGNALKTIYSRLGDLKLGETLEDGTTLGRISKNMEKVGVEVLDASGKMRDMGTIIEDLMKRWQKLTTAQKQGAAIALAGRYQYTRFMALLDNSKMYNEQLEASLESAGTIEQQQSIYMESLEAKQAKIKAGFEGIINSLFNSDDIKPMLDALAGVADAIQHIIDGIGGGIPIITAFGSTFTRVFSKQISAELSNAFSNRQMKKLASQFNDNDARTLLAGMGMDDKVQGTTSQALVTAAKINKRAAPGLSAEQAKMQNEYLQQAIDSANKLEEEYQQISERIQVINTLFKNNELGNINGDVIEVKNGVVQINDEVEILLRSLKTAGTENPLREILKEGQEGLAGMQDRIIELQGDLNRIGAQSDKNGTGFVPINVDNTKAIKNIAAELSNMNGISEEAKRRLNNITTGMEKLGEESNYTEEDIKQFGDQYKELNSIMAQFISILPKTKNLKEVFKSKDIDDSNLLDLATAYQLVIDKQEQFDDKLNDTNAFNANRFAMQQTIATITNAVGSLGQLSSAIMSVKNLGSIWADEDVDTGQKILQTIETLSFTLPMIISASRALHDIPQEIRSATEVRSIAPKVAANIETKIPQAMVENIVAKQVETEATEAATEEMDESTDAVKDNTEAENQNAAAHTANATTLATEAAAWAGLAEEIEKVNDALGEKDKTKEALEEITTETEDLVNTTQDAAEPIKQLDENMIDVGEDGEKTEGVLGAVASVTGNVQEAAVEAAGGADDLAKGLDKTGKVAEKTGGKVSKLKGIFKAMGGWVGIAMMAISAVIGIVSNVIAKDEEMKKKIQEDAKESYEQAKQVSEQLDKIEEKRTVFLDFYQDYKETGKVTDELKAAMVKYAETLGFVLKQEEIRKDNLEELNAAMEEERRIKALEALTTAQEGSNGNRTLNNLSEKKIDSSLVKPQYVHLDVRRNANVTDLSFDPTSFLTQEDLQTWLSQQAKILNVNVDQLDYERDDTGFTYYIKGIKNASQEVVENLVEQGAVDLNNGRSSIGFVLGIPEKLQPYQQKNLDTRTAVSSTIDRLETRVATLQAEKDNHPLLPWDLYYTDGLGFDPDNPDRVATAEQYAGAEYAWYQKKAAELATATAELQAAQDNLSSLIVQNNPYQHAIDVIKDAEFWLDKNAREFGYDSKWLSDGTKYYATDVPSFDFNTTIKEQPVVTSMLYHSGIDPTMYALSSNENGEIVVHFDFEESDVDNEYLVPDVIKDFFSGAKSHTLNVMFATAAEEYGSSMQADVDEAQAAVDKAQAAVDKAQAAVDGAIQEVDDKIDAVVNSFIYDPTALNQANHQLDVARQTLEGFGDIDDDPGAIQRNQFLISQIKEVNDFSLSKDISDIVKEFGLKDGDVVLKDDGSIAFGENVSLLDQAEVLKQIRKRIQEHKIAVDILINNADDYGFDDDTTKVLQDYSDTIQTSLDNFYSLQDLQDIIDYEKSMLATRFEAVATITAESSSDVQSFVANMKLSLSKDDQAMLDRYYTEQQRIQMYAEAVVREGIGGITDPLKAAVAVIEEIGQEDILDMLGTDDYAGWKASGYDLSKDEEYTTLYYRLADIKKTLGDSGFNVSLENVVEEIQKRYRGQADYILQALYEDDKFLLELAEELQSDYDPSKDSNGITSDETAQKVIEQAKRIHDEEQYVTDLVNKMVQIDKTGQADATKLKEDVEKKLANLAANENLSDAMKEQIRQAWLKDPSIEFDKLVKAYYNGLGEAYVEAGEKGRESIIKLIDSQDKIELTAGTFQQLDHYVRSIVGDDDDLYKQVMDYLLSLDEAINMASLAVVAAEIKNRRLSVSEAVSEITSGNRFGLRNEKGYSDGGLTLRDTARKTLVQNGGFNFSIPELEAFAKQLNPDNENAYDKVADLLQYLVNENIDATKMTTADAKRLFLEMQPGVEIKRPENISQASYDALTTNMLDQISLYIQAGYKPEEAINRAVDEMNSTMAAFAEYTKGDSEKQADILQKIPSITMLARVLEQATEGNIDIEKLLAEDTTISERGQITLGDEYSGFLKAHEKQDQTYSNRGLQYLSASDAVQLARMYGVGEAALRENYNPGMTSEQLERIFALLVGMRKDYSSDAKTQAEYEAMYMAAYRQYRSSNPEASARDAGRQANFTASQMVYNTRDFTGASYGLRSGVQEKVQGSSNIVRSQQRYSQWMRNTEKYDWMTPEVAAELFLTLDLETSDEVYAAASQQIIDGWNKYFANEEIEVDPVAVRTAIQSGVVLTGDQNYDQYQIQRAMYMSNTNGKTVPDWDESYLTWFQFHSKDEDPYQSFLEAQPKLFRGRTTTTQVQAAIIRGADEQIGGFKDLTDEAVISLNNFKQSMIATGQDGYTLVETIMKLTEGLHLSSEEMSTFINSFIGLDSDKIDKIQKWANSLGDNKNVFAMHIAITSADKDSDDFEGQVDEIYKAVASEVGDLPPVLWDAVEAKLQIDPNGKPIQDQVKEQLRDIDLSGLKVYDDAKKKEKDAGDAMKTSVETWIGMWQRFGATTQDILGQSEKKIYDLYDATMTEAEAWYAVADAALHFKSTLEGFGFIQSVETNIGGALGRELGSVTPREITDDEVQAAVEQYTQYYGGSANINSYTVRRGLEAQENARVERERAEIQQRYTNIAGYLSQSGYSWQEQLELTNRLYQRGVSSTVLEGVLSGTAGSGVRGSQVIQAIDLASQYGFTGDDLQDAAIAYAKVLGESETELRGFNPDVKNKLVEAVIPFAQTLKQTDKGIETFDQAVQLAWQAMKDLADSIGGLRDDTQLAIINAVQVAGNDNFNEDAKWIADYINSSPSITEGMMTSVLPYANFAQEDEKAQNEVIALTGAYIGLQRASKATAKEMNSTIMPALDRYARSLQRASGGTLDYNKAVNDAQVAMRGVYDQYRNSFGSNTSKIIAALAANGSTNIEQDMENFVARYGNGNLDSSLALYVATNFEVDADQNTVDAELDRVQAVLDNVPKELWPTVLVNLKPDMTDYEMLKTAVETASKEIAARQKTLGYTDVADVDEYMQLAEALRLTEVDSALDIIHVRNDVIGGYNQDATMSDNIEHLAELRFGENANFTGLDDGTTLGSGLQKAILQAAARHGEKYGEAAGKAIFGSLSSYASQITSNAGRKWLSDTLSAYDNGAQVARDLLAGFENVDVAASIYASMTGVKDEDKKAVAKTIYDGIADIIDEIPQDAIPSFMATIGFQFDPKKSSDAVAQAQQYVEDLRNNPAFESFSTQYGDLQRRDQELSKAGFSVYGTQNYSNMMTSLGFDPFDKHFFDLYDATDTASQALDRAAVAAFNLDKTFQSLNTSVRYPLEQILARDYALATSESAVDTAYGERYERHTEQTAIGAVTSIRDKITGELYGVDQEDELREEVKSEVEQAAKDAAGETGNAIAALLTGYDYSEQAAIFGAFGNNQKLSGDRLLSLLQAAEAAEVETRFFASAVGTLGERLSELSDEQVVNVAEAMEDTYDSLSMLDASTRDTVVKMVPKLIDDLVKNGMDVTNATRLAQNRAIALGRKLALYDTGTQQAIMSAAQVEGNKNADIDVITLLDQAQKQGMTGSQIQAMLPYLDFSEDDETLHRNFERMSKEMDDLNETFYNLDAEARGQLFNAMQDLRKRLQALNPKISEEELDEEVRKAIIEPAKQAAEKYGSYYGGRIVSTVVNRGGSYENFEAAIGDRSINGYLANYLAENVTFNGNKELDEASQAYVDAVAGSLDGRNLEVTMYVAPHLLPTMTDDEIKAATEFYEREYGIVSAESYRKTFGDNDVFGFDAYQQGLFAHYKSLSDEERQNYDYVEYDNAGQLKLTEKAMNAYNPNGSYTENLRAYAEALGIATAGLSRFNKEQQMAIVNAVELGKVTQDEANAYIEAYKGITTTSGREWYTRMGASFLAGETISPEEWLKAQFGENSDFNIGAYVMSNLRVTGPQADIAADKMYAAIKRSLKDVPDDLWPNIFEGAGLTGTESIQEAIRKLNISTAREQNQDLYYGTKETLERQGKNASDYDTYISRASYLGVDAGVAMANFDPWKDLNDNIYELQKSTLHLSSAFDDLDSSVRYTLADMVEQRYIELSNNPDYQRRVTLSMPFAGSVSRMTPDNSKIQAQLESEQQGVLAGFKTFGMDASAQTALLSKNGMTLEKADTLFTDVLGGIVEGGKASKADKALAQFIIDNTDFKSANWEKQGREYVESLNAALAGVPKDLWDTVIPNLDPDAPETWGKQIREAWKEAKEQFDDFNISVGVDLSSDSSALGQAKTLKQLYESVLKDYNTEAVTANGGFTEDQVAAYVSQNKELADAFVKVGDAWQLSRRFMQEHDMAAQDQTETLDHLLGETNYLTEGIAQLAAMQTVYGDSLDEDVSSRITKAFDIIKQGLLNIDNGPVGLMKYLSGIAMEYTSFLEDLGFRASEAGLSIDELLKKNPELHDLASVFTQQLSQGFEMLNRQYKTGEATIGEYSRGLATLTRGMIEAKVTTYNLKKETDGSYTVVGQWSEAAQEAADSCTLLSDQLKILESSFGFSDYVTSNFEEMSELFNDDFTIKINAKVDIDSDQILDEFSSTIEGLAPTLTAYYQKNQDALNVVAKSMAAQTNMTEDKIKEMVLNGEDLVDGMLSSATLTSGLVQGVASGTSEAVNNISNGIMDFIDAMLAYIQASSADLETSYTPSGFSSYAINVKTNEGDEKPLGSIELPNIMMHLGTKTSSGVRQGRIVSEDGTSRKATKKEMVDAAHGNYSGEGVFVADKTQTEIAREQARADALNALTRVISGAQDLSLAAYAPNRGSGQSIAPYNAEEGSGSGGGDSGGSEYEPKSLEPIEEEKDLYERINTLLEDIQKDLSLIADEQDRLVGDKLTANINKQINLTRKQIDYEQEKLDIMRKEAESVRERLAQEAGSRTKYNWETRQEVSIAGLDIAPEYDSEGFLTNYAAMWDAYLARINYYIAQYNAATTEEAQTYINLQVELAKEAFEKFKTDYARYDTLMGSEMNEQRNEIEKLKDSIEDLRIEALKTSIEAIDNIKEVKEQMIEFQHIFTWTGTDDPFRQTSISIQKLDGYLDNAHKTAEAFIKSLQDSADVDIANLEKQLANATTDLEKTKISDAIEAAKARKAKYPELVKEAQQRYNNGEGFAENGSGWLDIDMMLMRLMQDEAAQFETTGSSSIYGENGNALYDDMKEILDRAAKDFADAEKGLEDAVKGLVSEIDFMGKKFDERMEKYTNIDENLDHIMSMSQLLHGDSYLEQNRILSAQNKNSLAQIALLQERRDLMKELLEKVNDPDSPEAKAIIKEIEEADKSIRKEGENIANNIKQGRANSVNNAIRNFHTSMGVGAVGFDENGNMITRSSIFADTTKGGANRIGGDLQYAIQQWETMSRISGKVLDDVQRQAETQKLMNKYQDMLNKATDPVIQQKIRDAMGEQLADWEDIVHLSKYDVEYANAKLELLQKQIALEEAQRNKSQLKLKRDAQGNYSYVYTANTEDVDNLNNDILEARNNLYNMAKNAQMESYGDYLSTLQQYSNEINTIMNDASLTMEERLARANEFIQFAMQELGIISDQWVREREDTVNEAVDLYQSYPEYYSGLFGELAEMTKENVAENLDQIDQVYNMSMVQIIEDTQEAAANLETFYEKLQAIEESIAKSTETATQAVGENWNNLAEDLDPAKEAIEDLKKTTEEFLEVFNNLKSAFYDNEDRVSKFRESLHQESLAIQVAKEDYEKLADQYKQEQIKTATMAATIQDLQDQIAGKNDTGSGAGGTGGAGGSGGAGGNTGNGTPWTNQQLIEGIAGNIWTYGSWANDPTRHADLAARFGAEMAVAIQQFVNLGMDALEHDWMSGYYSQFGIDAFDTGGYTGDWGNDGRIAMLHQKELVLNKQDTENMLKAVGMLREIPYNAWAYGDWSSSARVPQGASSSSEQLEQNVHIEASFPGVQTAIEIEQALLGLADRASQYVWRK